MSRAAALVVAACLVAAVPFAATRCGPSELARAFDPLRSAVEQRLADESAFLLRTTELADDWTEAGFARYRAHLETEYPAYYDGLAAGVAAAGDPHPGLAGIRKAVEEYAAARREYGVVELRRLAVLVPRWRDVSRIQELQEARHEACQDYLESVRNDIPEPRYSEIVALHDTFLVTGPYARAVAGTGDASDAAEVLNKRLLPRIGELRRGRFDDSPQHKALRQAVATSEDFYRALAEHLLLQVEIARAAKRSEAAGQEADAARSRVVKSLSDVKRDL